MMRRNKDGWSRSRSLGLVVMLGASVALPAYATNDAPPPASIDADAVLKALPLPPEQPLGQDLQPAIDADAALKALPLPAAAAITGFAPPPVDAEAVLKALAQPEQQALPPALIARMRSPLELALQENVENLARVAPQEAAALTAAYEAHAFAPLFVGLDTIGPKAEAMIQRLARAGEDGLPTDAFTLTLPAATDAKTLAALDIRLARVAMLYAQQASGGQLEANRLSGNITVQPDFISPHEALAALTAADDPVAALESFNPPHQGFRALREQLAELRLDLKANSRTITTVLANMERWRWVPRDIGQTHIWVNIPEYIVRVRDNGAQIFETRAVVGKPQNQTPIFSHEMETVVVNPAWNVPSSILIKEMLGAARRDANYFASRGYQVIKGGRVVDPHTIDWSKPGNVSVRQPPGERNALGNLKFLFPNRHAVYLHDTPSRSLFSREARAFSHGCVRIQNPSQFAETVLGLANPDDGWSRGRIEGLYGRAERAVKMTRKIPIHLVYFTAGVNDDGKLVLRGDIYGHDARVTQALAARETVAAIK